MNDDDIKVEKIMRKIDTMINSMLYWFTEPEKQSKAAELEDHKNGIKMLLEEFIKGNPLNEVKGMLSLLIDSSARPQVNENSSLEQPHIRVHGRNNEHQSPLVGSSRPDEPVHSQVRCMISCLLSDDFDEISFSRTYSHIRLLLGMLHHPMSGWI